MNGHSLVDIAIDSTQHLPQSCSTMSVSEDNNDRFEFENCFVNCHDSVYKFPDIDSTKSNFGTIYECEFADKGSSSFPISTKNVTDIQHNNINSEHLTLPVILEAEQLHSTPENAHITTVNLSSNLLVPTETHHMNTVTSILHKDNNNSLLQKAVCSFESVNFNSNMNDKLCQDVSGLSTSIEISTSQIPSLSQKSNCIKKYNSDSLHLLNRQSLISLAKHTRSKNLSQQSNSKAAVSKKNRRKNKPQKMDTSELNSLDLDSPSEMDLCKVCSSRMVTVNTGGGHRSKVNETDEQDDSNSVDCVMFCLECTCDKINVLLEENDACDLSGDKSTVTCKKCFPHEVFENPQQYIEHYLNIHEGREPDAVSEPSEEYCQKCTFCLLYFRTEADLRDHELHHLGSDVINGTKLRCYLCSDEFNTMETLTEHQKNHDMLSGPFFCTICSQNFALASGLKNHILVYHQNLFCQFCHITFKEPKLLDEHLEVCERNTVDGLTELRNALQSHNDRDRFLPYSHTCSTCGKSFRLAWRYKLHLTKAKCLPADKFNSDSDRTCNICNKMFANPMNLHRHELIHAGIRNYSCDLCGKSFVQKTQLDTHLNIHRGIKPFNCEICNKSFTDRSTFHKHKKIHGKPKSFPCTVCGKVFNQAGYLKLHGKVHGIQVAPVDTKAEATTVSDFLC